MSCYRCCAGAAPVVPKISPGVSPLVASILIIQEAGRGFSSWGGLVSSLLEQVG